MVGIEKLTFVRLYIFIYFTSLLHFMIVNFTRYYLLVKLFVRFLGSFTFLFKKRFVAVNCRDPKSFGRGCPRGRDNWGTLRIPIDWETLGKIRGITTRDP